MSRPYIFFSVDLSRGWDHDSEIFQEHRRRRINCQAELLPRPTLKIIRFNETAIAMMTVDFDERPSSLNSSRVSFFFFSLSLFREMRVTIKYPVRGFRGCARRCQGRFLNNATSRSYWVNKHGWKNVLRHRPRTTCPVAGVCTDIETSI